MAGQSQSQDGGAWENCGRCGKPLVPEGLGTALKPAFEPIVLARKPLSEPTVAANVLKWRTGALNIDGCRIPATDKAKFPAGVVSESEAVFGGGEGMYANRPRPTDATPEGRWPANVVTDGSDEVVGMFPESNAGKSNPKLKRHSGGGVIYGECDGGQPKVSHGDSGSAARFFYSAKASKADRNGSKHPTVKPISLMEWLATLITPPGGTILDPFAGSGTTGAAATNKGFSCILCEREAEYVADIRARFFMPRREMLSTAALDAIRAEQALLPRLEALRARLTAC